MQSCGNIRPAISCDSGSLRDCYDSANQLYKPEERAGGTLQTFKEILETDHVFLIEDQDVVLGWISYKVLNVYLFVSGLYVRAENQRSGIAQRLVNTMVTATSGLGLSLCVLKVLKNAPWAMSFYRKNEFLLLEAGLSDPRMQCEIELMLEKTGLTINRWSYLLYKELKIVSLDGTQFL